jgi:excinuclease UvrABC nuclease subunit
VREEVEWSGFIQFDRQEIEGRVEARSGVYRLSSMVNENQYLVFYVGKAANLRNALLRHLSEDEKNVCILAERTKLCQLKVAYIDDKRERERMAREEIRRWNPPCNTRTKPPSNRC